MMKLTKHWLTQLLAVLALVAASTLAIVHTDQLAQSPVISLSQHAAFLI